MYQGYNFYQQPIPQQPGIKGRPVSSIEEVKAANIDFDGSIFYFPSLGERKIYTKQINIDGTSTLLEYELKDVPVEKIEYITRAEFEKALQELKKQKTNAEVLNF